MHQYGTWGSKHALHHLQLTVFQKGLAARNTERNAQNANISRRIKLCCRQLLGGLVYCLYTRATDSCLTLFTAPRA